MMGNVGGMELMMLLTVGVVVLSVVVASVVRSMAQKPSAFITQNTLAAHEMPPGVPVTVPFQATPGPHAVWLDVVVDGAHPMGFELWLAVRVGPHTLIEGRFPVSIDDENNARGLPNAAGTSALHTSASTVLGRRKIQSILRAFRFDVATVPAWGEVRASIMPFPGTTFSKCRLVVTTKDSPF